LESSKFSHSERVNDTTTSYEYSEKFETSKTSPDCKPADSAKTRIVPVQVASSPKHAQAAYNTQHFEYPVMDPSRREVGNAPSVEGCSSVDVGQSTTLAGAEPAAVDMLFSYHQMTQDTASSQNSTSTFSSRCSPAVTARTQQPSPASARPAVHPTHYYV